MLFVIYSKSNIQNFLILLDIFYVPFTIVKDADNVYSKRRLDRAKFTF